MDHRPNGHGGSGTGYAEDTVILEGDPITGQCLPGEPHRPPRHQHSRAHKPAVLPLKLHDNMSAAELEVMTGVTVRKRSIWVKIGHFFVPCDFEIWWMTFKENRAPLVCCLKLYASFDSHQWIQTGVTVRKRLIRVKIDNYLSCVTLKFDGWHRKTIGHLFYAMLSHVHHFKAIGEFKLKSQSGNAQFVSKSVIFYPVWPWNLTDDLEKQ